MKPLIQDKLHDPENGVRGNCMATCYASYLEIEIKDVPAFEEMFDTDKNWTTEMINWWTSIGYDYEVWDGNPFKEEYDDYYFVTGQSPRDPNVHHMVIYKAGEIVHDPHPDNTGIVTEKYFYVPRKLEDEKEERQVVRQETSEAEGPEEEGS